MEAAEADTIQTYTSARPFVPHEWVVRAVMKAAGGEVADPEQPEPDDCQAGTCDCPGDDTHYPTRDPGSSGAV
ncbi:MAG TPA: hypothetical protein VMZ53_03715 [Kofleriaceae bacterium]|nr:hypothetical protein [Kofleriaceae bacterium]